MFQFIFMKAIYIHILLGCWADYSWLVLRSQIEISLMIQGDLWGISDLV